MRYFILLFLLLINCYASFSQQIYYVANNGNDANNGISTGTPFRTLAKINSLALAPGDQVLLRRGDTFRGTLDLTRSGSTTNPITFSAYGTGAKPIIAGSSLLTNWVNTGNFIWQTTCPDCGTLVTGLYSNQISQPLGRFPNANTTNRGYLTVQSHTGKNTLVSQQPLATNWVGGEVVVRSNYFIIDRAPIIQQSSNTLTLNNSSPYDLSDQFGFFIQNHPATLDQQGEWYFNPSTKQISIYSNQINPNTQFISATVSNYGIIIRGCTNLLFDNLVVSETLNYGIVAANVSTITVRNCDIINSGENGIYLGGTGTNILFENNRIVSANNNGFQIDAYNNFIFRDNYLTKIATEPGRGKSGDAQYIAFLAYTQTSTTIERNRIDSVGYHALTFPKRNALIQQNIISNFCLTKSDGGGLYVTNNAQESMGNVTLLQNIIYNGIGAREGSPDGFLGANGIYLDECIDGVTVRRNTTYQCNHFGIYLHGTRNSLVDDNVSYDNKDSQFVMDYTNLCASNNNTTQNNVFVSKLTNQYTANYNSYFSDLSTFGTFQSNVYARPLEDVQTLRLSYRPPNGQLFDPRSLTEWQTDYGKDLNSTRSPITYPNFFLNAFTGPERVVGGDFTTGTGYGSGGPFIFSDYNNGQGTWDNNNRINGGSLNLNFTSITNNPGASLYAAQVVNTVSAQKDYLIEFDAVSTVPNRLVQVYMQPQFAPFTALVDTRPAVVVGTTPQHYQVLLRPNRDLQNALAILRVFESNQPLFIDNFSFREVDATRLDPNTVLRLVYNPAPRDTTILLSGSYRDARNQLYNGQITLPAYGSTVLLRENPAFSYPFDLSMTIWSDLRTQRIGQPIPFKIRIRNHTDRNLPSIRAQWTSRIPANLQVVSSPGLSFANGILSGTVNNLRPLTDTTFTFSVQPTTAAIYRLAAQITTTTYPDPDSMPNTGTGDGEDDQTQAEIRTKDLADVLIISSNPAQQALPNVLSNELPPAPTTADLNLRSSPSKRAVALNEVVSFTITLTNRGGAAVQNVQVSNELPSGFSFVNDGIWTVNGNVQTRTIANLTAGASIALTLQARAITSGFWTNRSQITSSNLSDPDSAPNNGFTNGEDDQSQFEITVR